MGGARAGDRAGVAVTLLALSSIAFPAEAAVRHAFVTSSLGTGDFSQWPGNLDGGLTGLAAANKICQNSAAASSLASIATNSASFRAWVSTVTTDAFCNVLGLTGTRDGDCGGAFNGQSAGPWARPDGLAWAGDLLAVASSGAIYRQLAQDEDGLAIVTEPQHWTGTEPDGVRSTDDCSGWTAGSSVSGVYGRAPNSAGASWTHWNDFVCNTPSRLLCLQGAAGDFVPVDQGPGALVFASSATGKGDASTWPQSGGAAGLAGADSICQQLAGGAHLPSPASFVAWLSTESVDAIDRLTTDGPFRRIDGVRIATNKATLVLDFREAPIHQTEEGVYLGYRRVFTGTNFDGVGSGVDCIDWTNSVSGTGTSGQVALFARNWSQEPTSAPCNTPFGLYCFSNVVSIFWSGFEAPDPDWTDAVGLP